MATIPELLDGHITLEVECLDRLYLNGYIGRLATGPELSMFMRNQLGKPVPSPVVLGQVSERFREAVKTLAGGEDILRVGEGVLEVGGQPEAMLRRQFAREFGFLGHAVHDAQAAAFALNGIENGLAPTAQADHGYIDHCCADASANRFRCLTFFGCGS